MDCSPWLLYPWTSPGKNTGEELPFHSPGDLPDPGIELRSPALQADSLPSEPPGKPIRAFLVTKKQHPLPSYSTFPFGVKKNIVHFQHM